MLARIACTTPALFGVGGRPQLLAQRCLATLVTQPFRQTERAKERRWHILDSREPSVVTVLYALAARPHRGKATRLQVAHRPFRAALV